MARKLTNAEWTIIRQCACKDAMVRRVTLEVGERYCGGDLNVNIAALTSDEHWGDTDLNTTHNVAWLRRFGFDLTVDGRAILDFYVYEPSHDDHHGDLLTNVVAYWEDGRLVRVLDTAHRPLWEDKR